MALEVTCSTPTGKKTVTVAADSDTTIGSCLRRAGKRICKGLISATDSSGAPLKLNTKLGKVEEDQKVSLTVVTSFQKKNAFKALKQDGSVVTWGYTCSGGDIKIRDELQAGGEQLCATMSAFAVLKQDGSVVTWGDSCNGGDSSSVEAKLQGGVEEVFATQYAFAALKQDGSLVTWGDLGDHSGIKTKLQGGVEEVVATDLAFAVLKRDSSVVTLGDESSMVKDKLQKGVEQLVATKGCFAALKQDGSVVTWGDSFSAEDLSMVKDKLQKGVEQLVATDGAFAALKQDGSVAVWGDAEFGGDAVPKGCFFDATASLRAAVPQLQGGVEQVCATKSAFAALKQVGSVVAWGDFQNGGDISMVEDKLQGGVEQLVAANCAFAALKQDGSVVTWGDFQLGGDSSMVQDKLQGGVTQLVATDQAFAALKQDGSVVTWGLNTCGGDSSNVQDQLREGVEQVFPTNVAMNHPLLTHITVQLVVCEEEGAPCWNFLNLSGIIVASLKEDLASKTPDDVKTVLKEKLGLPARVVLPNGQLLADLAGNLQAALEQAGS